MALSLDKGLNPLLSELTADPRGSEEALREPEEASDPADTVCRPGTATPVEGTASPVPCHGLARDGVPRRLPRPSPAREELFTFRVQVAEAGLRRLHASSCLAPPGPAWPAPKGPSPRPGQPCPTSAVRYPACGVGRELRGHLHHPPRHLL